MPKMCTIFGMCIKCLTAIANKYLQANNLADRFTSNKWCFHGVVVKAWDYDSCDLGFDPQPGDLCMEKQVLHKQLMYMGMIYNNSDKYTWFSSYVRDTF